MNSINGIVMAVIGGQRDGTYFNQDGKCRAVVVVDEDQSWLDKQGNNHIWHAKIPFSFYGKEAERISMKPEHYIGKLVKVQFQLGGYERAVEKGGGIFASIKGVFLHSNDGEETPKEQEIAF